MDLMYSKLKAQHNWFQWFGCRAQDKESWLKGKNVELARDSKHKELDQDEVKGETFGILGCQTS